MPKNQAIKKVLVIGSGPIVIGQAAEFDYAGTQACRTLRQEGLEVVLVNSNPATIMTDSEMAEKVYLEPLQASSVQKILLREKADSLLASLGGQTALNIAMELTESGFLAAQGVQLLGTQADGIRRGEDRELFRAAMQKIGIPCVPSGIGHSVDECLALAREIGYPVIVRPAFTLGGTGGGIVRNAEELIEIAENGLAVSRVHQVLVEKSIAGWKEIEYETVRDAAGNAITICSMENFDPVGVHTGDSIVFAPALTLNDREIQTLRDASLSIVHELGIVGGCNVQFALHPTTGDYAVIEVNPRLSRSSALASKATGYPIAKVATRIALGYRLDEIANEVTGSTWAAAEPVLDYVVTKIPKWPFDKFTDARRNLGTQMKATGEIMAIGTTLENSLLKALRSLEQGYDGLYYETIAGLSDEELETALDAVDDRRIFYLAEALRRGQDAATLSKRSGVTAYFLVKLGKIMAAEEALLNWREDGGRGDAAKAEAEKKAEAASGPTEQQAVLLARAWDFGFSDRHVARLTGLGVETIRKWRIAAGYAYVYRTVDTCAGEFAAKTPYFYGSYGTENEAVPDSRRKALVLGSGPIRIGQGIEFDYCSVHCVQALKELGYESIIINNNPETVSTDFDISNRLYFEPLTLDDVRGVLDNEKPDGVICQFGGQTAIKLIKGVSDLGYPAFGTTAEGVDRAEDRERFDAVLSACEIPRPRGLTIMTDSEAVRAAAELGYPVLLRPSYVLGGQGMQICYDEQAVKRYMALITRHTQEHPILVDKYLMGMELEVDALSDGEDILIPGIMEHLERAGVHSGDSISIFPAYVSESCRKKITSYTAKLAKALEIRGLLNIQFIFYNDELYVLEVNPRSSRTVPYISKVTGLPIVKLATRVMLGERIRDLGCGTGLYARYPAVYAIKAPVFSFEKLHDVDTLLGPEMKSTGEVLGLADTYGEAMYKAILASGFKFPKHGEGLLLSVRDSDKAELLPLAERLYALGYTLYATGGTAHYLNMHGVPCNVTRRLGEAEPNVSMLVREHKVGLLVNTSERSERGRDDFRLRRLCIEHGVATLTSLDTLEAVTQCLERGLTSADLMPYAIADFSRRVSETRFLTRPLSEMNSDERHSAMTGALEERDAP